MDANRKSSDTMESGKPIKHENPADCIAAVVRRCAEIADAKCDECDECGNVQGRIAANDISDAIRAEFPEESRG